MKVIKLINKIGIVEKILIGFTAYTLLGKLDGNGYHQLVLLVLLLYASKKIIIRHLLIERIRAHEWTWTDTVPCDHGLKES